MHSDAHGDHCHTDFDFRYFSTARRTSSEVLERGSVARPGPAPSLPHPNPAHALGRSQAISSTGGREGDGCNVLDITCVTLHLGCSCALAALSAPACLTCLTLMPSIAKRRPQLSNE